MKQELRQENSKSHEVYLLKKR